LIAAFGVARPIDNVTGLSRIRLDSLAKITNQRESAWQADHGAIFPRQNPFGNGLHSKLIFDFNLLWILPPIRGGVNFPLSYSMTKYRNNA